MKKKRPYNKKALDISPFIDADVDTFKIELAPPPAIRGGDPERLKFLAKLQRTVGKVQPGQAFIIPTNFRNSAERYLKVEVPSYRFAFMAIPDNQEATRVYKFEWATAQQKK